MEMTDAEIIKSLRIKPSEKVLDIGGSMMQHTEIIVDTIVDLIPPEKSPYTKSKLRAKRFVKCDITREKLPFDDNEFDTCLCTHTLEDLPMPFLAMEEMQRVAKRGLIVTPSMGYDMVFGPIDYTNWLTGARRVPGEGHHKWFFVKEGKRLKVIPKVYPVLYSSDFQVTGWLGKKEMIYYWKGGFEFEEVEALNIHKLIDEYARFLKKNRRLIKTGVVAVFLDTPINLAKALIKKILHRGHGYSYRKTA